MFIHKKGCAMRCINAKKNVVIFLFVCSVLAFGASMVWAEDPVAQELLFDYSSAITQLTSGSIEIAFDNGEVWDSSNPIDLTSA